MESNKSISEVSNGYENSEEKMSSGLGRGLDALLGDRNKRTSFGLGKGLGAFIGGCNKHTSSSDKK